MGRYQRIDEKGRGLGLCGYCMKEGQAKNLKELPEKYRGVPSL